MKTLISVLYLHDPLSASHGYDIAMVIVTMTGVLFALKATNGALAARTARANFAKNGDQAKLCQDMLSAQQKVRGSLLVMASTVAVAVILRFCWNALLAG